jgi:hypothetical protein
MKAKIREIEAIALREQEKARLKQEAAIRKE